MQSITLKSFMLSNDWPQTEGHDLHTWTFEENVSFALQPLLVDLVNRLVEEKVDAVIKKKTGIVFRDISNEVAKQEISKFFIEKLAEGKTKVDVLDVVLSLNLPGTQVEHIFDEFVKEKKAKKI